jgi:tetratricopeptide (TPR) repeat protein
MWGDGLSSDGASDAEQGVRSASSIAGAAMPGPRPTGTLAAFPLPVLFAHVIEHELSGSLALMPSDGSAREGVDVIVFASGAPTRVRTSMAIAPLGEMLVRFGVLANVDLESALARAGAAKARLGAQLVSEKVIDRRILLEALRQQVLVRLRALATLPEGTRYEFHANADLLEEGPPTNAASCDPLAGLHAIVRAWPARARIEATLDPLAESEVALHPSAAPRRFDLDEVERAVLERIEQGPRTTFATLARTTRAPANVARALLYTLVLSRHLDVGDDHWPLGVALPSPEGVSALRDSSLGRGIDKLRTSQMIRALGAAEDYKEADALARAERWEEAEVLATRAVERDPGPPEHRALLATILFERSPQNLKRALALLESALTDAGPSDALLVRRAKLLERAGRAKEALRDWQAAASINPRNPDARLALKAAANASSSRAPAIARGWWIFVAISTVLAIVGIAWLARR